MLWILTPAASAWAQSSVVLHAEEVLDSNTLTLTWNGGTGPYVVHRMSQPQGCKAEFIPAIGQDHSFPVASSDNLIYFLVSDASPGASVNLTSPAPGTAVNTSTVSAAGTITPASASVCVNNEVATVTGGGFSASSVLLAIGSNTLFATASTSNGNLVKSPTVTINRNALNQPPSVVAGLIIQCDRTPRLSVTLTDPTGMNLATFRAILDGGDVTTSFVQDSSTGSPPTQAAFHMDVPPGTPLAKGTHTLRFTVSDTLGSVGHVTRVWTTDGPRISGLSKRDGVPNESLTITGCFSPVLAENTVRFNGTQATVTAASAASITVTVPAGATDGSVTVTVDNFQSNEALFDVAFSTLSTQGFDAGIVAVDASGVVYFSSTNGIVYRVPPAGGNPAPILNLGAEEITGLRFDAAQTTLFVLSRGPEFVDRDLPEYLQERYGVQQWRFLGGRVRMIQPGGAVSIIATLPTSGQFLDPVGIAVDATQVYLHLKDAFNFIDYTASIPRTCGSPCFSITTLDQFAFSQYLPWSLARDSNGRRFLSYCDDNSQCALYRNGTYYFRNFNNDVLWIAVDCRGYLYVTDTSSAVFEINGSVAPAVAQPVVTSTAGFFGAGFDSNGNLYVSNVVSNEIYRTLFRNTACANDFTVALSGGASKLIADTSPSGETPEAQYVVLTASFVPAGPGAPLSIPPGFAAVWSCSDPDDPAVDTSIDANSNGNDNTGSLDPPALPFVAELGYPVVGGGVTDCKVPGNISTSIDANNQSKIAFHYTDAPGDNFNVTVSLGFGRPTGPVTRTNTTETMTVWKRLKVEADSMGENVGPYDSNGEDAFIGDVSAADTSMLSAAFQQAFVEVQLAGPGSQNDVFFDPHVPNSFSQPNDPADGIQIRFQGSQGRDFSSMSGAWRAYVQHSYESYTNQDSDPGTENLTVGIHNSGYALLFAESIRDEAETKFSIARPGCNFVMGFDELYRRRAVALHELGHEFGIGDPLAASCDGSHGIMEEGSRYPYFIGDQVSIIRRASVPGN